MAKRESVDEKLDALEALSPGDRPAFAAAIEAAIGGRHYRVVAKAARLAAEALVYELEPALLRAYASFLERPVKRDPNCLAKKAIVRALVELDCSDSGFFLEGLRYRQPEPVWGGTTDTAVDVRSACAMGLVAAGYPRALVEIAELLADPDAAARAGAVRAVACGDPREAELLLRAKVFVGDAEPEVVGECFTALLGVAPDESPAFVARYLADEDEAVRELAALTLGESRLPAAFEYLRAAWDDVLPPPGLRRALIRGAAMHRSDDAFEWLLSLVADSQTGLVAEIIDTLAIYKHNRTLAERLETVLTARADRVLARRYAELWE